ncbi:protein YgfX [Vogesella oryzae]|uniref:protein YgfX n=1 Tax=Vogesella oryzae TaxID=1735285 RepID=UPI00158296C9|nr:hypothetical protein [Vogesella oryzae]
MHPQRVTPFGAKLRCGVLLPAVLIVASLLLVLAARLLPWWQLLPLMFGWILVIGYLLRQSGMLAAPLQGFRVEARGRLAIQLQDGAWLAAHLLSASTAFIWLVSLKMIDETGRHHQLLVWRSTVDAETHRALRVYVQWSRDTATPVADSTRSN